MDNKEKVLSVLIVVGIISIIGIIIYFGLPKEKIIKVDSVSWERTVEVEHYEQVEKSGSYLPADAEFLFTSEEPDGTDSNGNTTYKTVYYYKEYEWVHKRDVVTAGNDKIPYWGDLNLGDKERESYKYEQYSVNYLNNKGKIKDYSIDYSRWCDIVAGQTIKVKVSFFTIIKIIDVLEK